MMEDRISEEKAKNLLENCGINIKFCFSSSGKFAEEHKEKERAEKLAAYCKANKITLHSLYPFLEKARYEISRTPLRTRAGITHERIEEIVNDSKPQIEADLAEAKEFFRSRLEEKTNASQPNSPRP